MRSCSATASAISARPWPAAQYHRLAMRVDVLVAVGVPHQGALTAGDDGERRAASAWRTGGGTEGRRPWRRRYATSAHPCVTVALERSTPAGPAPPVARSGLTWNLQGSHGVDVDAVAGRRPRAVGVDVIALQEVQRRQARSTRRRAGDARPALGPQALADRPPGRGPGRADAAPHRARRARSVLRRHVRSGRGAVGSGSTSRSTPTPSSVRVHRRPPVAARPRRATGGARSRLVDRPRRAVRCRSRSSSAT